MGPAIRALGIFAAASMGRLTVITQLLMRAIGSVTTTLQVEIASLRNEMKSEVSSLRTEMDARFNGLRAQIDGVDRDVQAITKRCFLSNCLLEGCAFNSRDL